ncbi:MAG: DUF1501 domain-containing protein [Verrucomicrobiales bacterium]|nr:DUF1501 domain-containing protein [Verrucomicrobiales bacterium]
MKPSSPPSGLCSRRHFAKASAFGLGSAALAYLLKEEGLLAEPARPELEARSYDLQPKPPLRQARARAMISILMVGGPSHIDLFDPKPLLKEYEGRKFPGELKFDNAGQASAKVLPGLWEFKKHGQSGIELSTLLPHLGAVADEICVVRSMQTGVNNHGQSLYALASGRITAGAPTLGSWINFGLGSESQELPAYITLTHPSGPPQLADHHWSNGWLPSVYQGAAVKPQEPRILNLDPAPHLKGPGQARQLELLRDINREHLRQHPGELDLEARIASYELAARMQTSAKEAMDISSESEATRQLYGVDQDLTRDYGTRCLIARRLVERGVRFVQIINNGQSWDQHSGLVKALPDLCARSDRPTAALVADLKSRGLLDTTLVHWGGEMGRLPVIQNDLGREKVGRDHNTYGFTMWLAGGGIRGGMTYGETDEWGHKAVKDIVTHHDYHATLLHLFGLDHTQLIYRRAGRELSLTDRQPARIVREIIQTVT